MTASAAVPDAQRRRGRIGIARLDPPAGEADLSSVIVKMQGPQGKKNSEPRGMIDQRHEDRCGHERLAVTAWELCEAAPGSSSAPDAGWIAAKQ